MHIFMRAFSHGLYKATMSILQLGPVIFGPTSDLVDYFQQKGLLAAQKQCGCGAAMCISPRSDVSDGCRFRCPDCHKCISIRDESFFSKSRITLQKWLVLMYWWAKTTPSQLLLKKLK